MLFSSNDLINELLREKERIARIQRNLIDEVHDLIQQGEREDAGVIQRITKGSLHSLSGLHTYNERNVFSLEVIKSICIQYRLRFLPSANFKPQIPYEALLKVKELERVNETEIRECYVMAPAEAFRLEKKTDPLLFVFLGNEKYLLIHRWGKDLSGLRKIISYPMRSVSTMMTAIISVSLLIAILLPSSWIAPNEHFQKMIYSVRMYIFFILMLGGVIAAVYIHIRRNKNLSEDEWDSKYL